MKINIRQYDGHCTEYGAINNGKALALVCAELSASRLREIRQWVFSVVYPRETRRPVRARAGASHERRTHERHERRERRRREQRHRGVA